MIFCGGSLSTNLVDEVHVSGWSSRYSEEHGSSQPIIQLHVLLQAIARHDEHHRKKVHTGSSAS